MSGIAAGDRRHPGNVEAGGFLSGRLDKNRRFEKKILKNQKNSHELFLIFGNPSTVFAAFSVAMPSQ
jgi:hypothetical protein